MTDAEFKRERERREDDVFTHSQTMVVYYPILKSVRAKFPPNIAFDMREWEPYSSSYFGYEGERGPMSFHPLLYDGETASTYPYVSKEHWETQTNVATDGCLVLAGNLGAYEEAFETPHDDPTYVVQDWNVYVVPGTEWTRNVRWLTLIDDSETTYTFPLITDDPVLFKHTLRLSSNHIYLQYERDLVRRFPVEHDTKFDFVDFNRWFGEHDVTIERGYRSMKLGDAYDESALDAGVRIRDGPTQYFLTALVATEDEDEVFYHVRASEMLSYYDVARGPVNRDTDR